MLTDDNDGSALEVGEDEEAFLAARKAKRMNEGGGFEG
jgi:hypothetical protein